ncbi:MAG: hypothetical protein WB036_06015 [Pseudolabrys sp.]|jgi:hypothetical protein
MTDADKEPDLKVNIEQTAHPDAYVVKIEIFGDDAHARESFGRAVVAAVEALQDGEK